MILVNNKCILLTSLGYCAHKHPYNPWLAKEKMQVLEAPCICDDSSQQSVARLEKIC